MDNWIELGYSKQPRNEVWKRGPGEVIANLLEIIEREVNSVPYRVSKRWAFYRLWQLGVLSHYGQRSSRKAKQAAYDGFCQFTSKAVHSGWWAPDYFSDDTRHPYGERYYSVDDWHEELKQVQCHLDRWVEQKEYIMVVFEAAAMFEQFYHYTQDYAVMLWPFRGDPSNPYKNQIAEKIDEVSARFNKDVVLLYFGDLDPKGMQIAETAARHIRKWATYPFDAYRVGLIRGDELRFNLPENPERPGAYQWEALQDTDAGALIQGALNHFYSQGSAKPVEALEQEHTHKVRAALEAL